MNPEMGTTDSLTSAPDLGRWTTAHTRSLYPLKSDPVPTVQEVGWAPRPMWTGAENSPPTGIGSPDRQARSQSLQWLSLVLVPEEDTWHEGQFKQFLWHKLHVSATTRTLVGLHWCEHHLQVGDSPSVQASNVPPRTRTRLSAIVHTELNT